MNNGNSVKFLGIEMPYSFFKFEKMPLWLNQCIKKGIIFKRFNRAYLRKPDGTLEVIPPNYYVIRLDDQTVIISQ